MDDKLMSLSSGLRTRPLRPLSAVLLARNPSKPWWVPLACCSCADSNCTYLEHGAELAVLSLEVRHLLLRYLRPRPHRQARSRLTTLHLDEWHTFISMSSKSCSMASFFSCR
jgi:hypothetical protein